MWNIAEEFDKRAIDEYLEDDILECRSVWVVKATRGYQQEAHIMCTKNDVSFKNGHAYTNTFNFHANTLSTHITSFSRN